jgi:hypothetical protein
MSDGVTPAAPGPEVTVDRRTRLQRSGVHRISGPRSAIGGALARDHRRRRRVDRRDRRPRGGGRRAGGAASVQQGQRRSREDRDPSGDGRLRADCRRRRAHQPSDAARLVSHLDAYDLVVGARTASTQANNARRIGNAVLNGVASYLTEQHIPDLTSGFRAARREYLLEFLHLLPNGFSTPTTTTLAFIKAGYSVRFEPVQAAQRQGVSKIRLGPDGVQFFMILLKVVTIFSPLRLFLPVSAVAFLVGAAYAVWTIFTQSHVTNSSVLLIVLSVVILLVGLVSEQISSLRFEGRRS